MSMEGMSVEERLIQECPHCDPDSFALKHPLEETENYWVVCDVHPLTEGHILIMPKFHLACVGVFSEEMFDELVELYALFSEFLAREYGRVATFEHGKIGQTVFHSHVHLLPWEGNPTDIVPEGKEYLEPLTRLSDLKEAFERQGKYLFFTIENDMWMVDVSLGEPGFFRDRSAAAVGNQRRGDWKQMRKDREMMAEASYEISRLEDRWGRFESS